MPEVGRFASPDTIVPDPGNPQSLNRYAYVLNSPINFSDPTGHRPCGFACPDDAITHDILFGAAWEGDWDVQQQATNVARAETIARAASETTAGILWEPADWAIALSDGLQWYDGISFLPLVPATVGRYADEVVPISQRAIGGTAKAYDKLNAQGLYVLLDEVGDVRYVGRGDAPRRLATHRNDPIKGNFEQLIVAQNNLTYAEARGLEQLLVLEHGGLDTLVNLRNGIDPRNANLERYLAAGQTLLQEALQIIRSWGR